MFEFKFPDVGEGIAEGEIVRWLVSVGETVRAHQPLVEMETDKAVVEIPSPVSGVISELRGSEGDTVAVGAVLVVVDEGGAQPRTQEPAAPAPQQPNAVGVVGQLEEAPSAPPKSEPVAGGAAESPVKVLPKDRILAKKLGVDLYLIEGSGPAGRITEENIRAAAKTVEGVGARGRQPDERLPLKGVRKAMARAMTASAFSAVHVTVMDRSDATALRELRNRERPLVEGKGLRLTYLPFVVKALTLALEKFPLLNSSMDESGAEIILHRELNIGFAVDTPEGLLVPVIRKARNKSILQLAAALQDLALRARERNIAPVELQGGTFTVSNYGAIGGLWGTPIINPPQSAILGVGRIEEMPVVWEGKVVARPVVPLALTFDHRIIDGATAQRFLNSLIELIENPDLILLEN